MENVDALRLLAAGMGGVAPDKVKAVHLIVEFEKEESGRTGIIQGCIGCSSHLLGLVEYSKRALLDGIVFHGRDLSEKGGFTKEEGTEGERSN